MLIDCDCGDDTFKLNFIPPTGVEAICAECGETQPIGETDEIKR